MSLGLIIPRLLHSPRIVVIIDDLRLLSGYVDPHKACL